MASCLLRQFCYIWVHSHRPKASLIFSLIFFTFAFDFAQCEWTLWMPVKPGSTVSKWTISKVPEYKHFKYASLEERYLVLLVEGLEHLEMLGHLDEASHRHVCHVEELAAGRVVVNRLVNRRVERHTERCQYLQWQRRYRWKQLISNETQQHCKNYGKSY